MKNASSRIYRDVYDLPLYKISHYSYDYCYCYYYYYHHNHNQTKNKRGHGFFAAYMLLLYILQLIAGAVLFSTVYK
jgi:hypothetical protein